QGLAALVALVRAALPGFPITIDPGEFRGAEYHTGVAFTLFARGVRGEICGGGRYQAASGEAATGLTIYMDSLGRALAEPPTRPRVFVPLGVARAEAAALRRDGWRTVAGLEDAVDARAEAGRLGCTHVYLGGQVTAV
ncbi:MAG: ATP phosphoribosyltransferase regulatory subunit, partial [Alphaproteobacteria bacterium]|nr:ATP phosphoribosyltransferase regulatory subunit [Alphaproteobacteria bacterium]